MEPIGWISLGTGIVFILGAWTNWFNYYGDERDDECFLDYAGWVFFHFVFFKNRKAYRIFLFSVGIFFTVNTIYFCPAAKAFLKASGRILIQALYQRY